ncbi:MAG: hypothetical protein JXC33_07600 [Deltaproteobacteria bacterium]|nr:hypothetical protein [Deltaproteobacteria bacterium]
MRTVHEHQGAAPPKGRKIKGGGVPQELGDPTGAFMSAFAVLPLAHAGCRLVDEMELSRGRDIPGFRIGVQIEGEDAASLRGVDHQIERRSAVEGADLEKDRSLGAVRRHMGQNTQLADPDVAIFRLMLQKADDFGRNASTPVNRRQMRTLHEGGPPFPGAFANNPATVSTGPKREGKDEWHRIRDTIPSAWGLLS